VWDRRPDAEALLRARVARGWQPTPTDTRDGPVVMGYACRLRAP
jgi:hypothetical protein